MLVPISWLKEYIDISLPPKALAERLTEVGLGVEKITKSDQDTIFELEITPNRPDCLSIIGVAREVAAIEHKKISFPKLKTDLKPKNATKILPLTIYPNFKITSRLTGIIINNVKVKDSSPWLKSKLELIGQRPINNIVDITNYVMFELGNPIHSFDYHKIQDSKMWVTKAKGGEEFESVDEISYRLPKDAIIYKDTKKIFDLVGIKGGKNSGTYENTKAVLIVVEVDDPVLIRKASQALALRSQASAIFERKVNAGGTIDALKRCVDLILDETGGEIASNLIDLKEQRFEPWKLIVSAERLNKILGIEIPQAQVLSILKNLNLSPVIARNKVTKQSLIECTIPTYRNDLQIEEDLIEEVARLYGYNNFPKTLPTGEIPTQKVPYFKNYDFEENIKQYLKAAGFSEIYTYSLVSEQDIIDMNLNPDDCLRVDNPVSRDFEYLRPTLKINLAKALIQNIPNASNINLFEMGKVYLGKSIDKKEEPIFLSAISNNKSYFEIKGILQRLFNKLGINEDPSKFIVHLPDASFFEVSFTEIEQKAKLDKKFIPIPKFPSIFEDLALIASKSVKTGDIISEIKKQSKLIAKVSLLDQFENTRTFHITYQDPNKNLSSKDIEPIRNKIIKTLSERFGAKLKK